MGVHFISLSVCVFKSVHKEKEGRPLHWLVSDQRSFDEAILPHNSNVPQKNSGRETGHFHA